ncbi:hypothetical protein ACIGZJ_36070 [Kitasatospora sp. NPDC052868]|uniref:hypothetical protein n=1 Tax=Kitasatospora sp. NPDC052868 TaxID=3364060 RepID=UPI0037CBE83B
MTSWKAVTRYVPQCSLCLKPFRDEHGQELHLPEERLPQGVRERFTAAGWQVTDYTHTARQRLECAACSTAQAARVERYQAQLNQPLVKTVDMSDKLGPGWTLGQREGDEVTQTWVVVHDGQVRGMVRRYKRKASEGWSRGWEAFYLGRDGAGMLRQEAITAASWSDRSNSLWRSRDLAAWGVVTQPVGYSGTVPGWATRTTKTKEKAK